MDEKDSPHVRSPEEREEAEGVWAGILSTLGCLGFAGLPLTIAILGALFAMGFVAVLMMIRSCSGG